MAIAAIAVSLAGGEAVAQSGSNVRVPAEFPPASYTGKQYVDSRGCVFIRAGIDGNVSWIPRMSRSRQVICGFKPSLPNATAQAAQPQPSRTAKAPEPTIITVPQQQPTAKAKPATQPKAVVLTQPAKPKPVAKPAQPVTAVPKVVMAPTTTVVQKPAKTVKVTKAVPSQATQASRCQGASAVSAQYLQAGRNVEVRCGPQTQPHATVIYRSTSSDAVVVPGSNVKVIRQTGAGVASGAVQTAPSAQVRVVPRHVYEQQMASVDGISVPSGYKPVWEDDRLNPKRAQQTFEGMAQTDLAWTRTVPRLLIDRRTGREVTYKYPGLQYPYVSYEQQRAAGVTVSTQGKPVAEPVRVVRMADGTVKRVVKKSELKRKVKVVTQAQTATVSTKSAPKAVAKAASHRYVQAGMFGNPSNAKRAAQMIANSGLPARMGEVKRNGKSYTIVLAGPFQTQAQLDNGLRKVRRAGFGDAFPRN